MSSKEYTEKDYFDFLIKDAIKNAKASLEMEGFFVSDEDEKKLINYYSSDEVKNLFMKGRK